MRSISILFLLVLGFVFVLGATSCDDDNEASLALLRILHDSPDAPAVDGFVDDVEVVSDLDYLEVFPTNGDGYALIPSGINNIKVNAAGTNITVIDADLDFPRNSETTIIVTGLLEDDSIFPIVLDDDNSLPANGFVKLRAVHGAPGVGNVDIYVVPPGVDINDVDPTLSDVPFGAASGYLEVPEGSYQVIVTPTGTKIIAIDTGPIEFFDGQIRTAVAVDSQDFEGDPFIFLLLDRN
ncbi:MAG: DUF4397 domain-containing protein [Thermodesulfobacteriota bacterium]